MDMHGGTLVSSMFCSWFSGPRRNLTPTFAGPSPSRTLLFHAYAALAASQTLAVHAYAAFVYLFNVLLVGLGSSEEPYTNPA